MSGQNALDRLGDAVDCVSENVPPGEARQVTEQGRRDVVLVRAAIQAAEEASTKLGFCIACRINTGYGHVDGCALAALRETDE